MIPTMIQIQKLSAQYSKKIKVFEMMCLRNICDIRKVRELIVLERVKMVQACRENIIGKVG